MNDEIKMDDNNNNTISKSLLINIKNNNNNIRNENITCTELLQLKPDKHGILYKYNNSIWRILLILFPWLYEKWKKRYFVLIGNYLYKFKHDNDDKIRGSPIPLEAILEVKIINDKKNKYDNNNINNMNNYFEIITLKKTYILKTNNYDEMIRWMNVIKRRKLQSIKEIMGHSRINMELKRINDIGMKLVLKKLSYDRKYYYHHHNNVDSTGCIISDVHNPYITHITY